MKPNSVDFFQTNNPIPVPDYCELILAVWEIGNPENAGHIIRLAHNAGAKKVLFVKEKINLRESKIRKTAGFSFDQMDWEFVKPDSFPQKIAEGCQLIALETCNGSRNIFKTELPCRMVILAGNESHGLPKKIIDMCSGKIHIPMPGECKSMNVSHALSIAVFEWYRQFT